MQKYLLIDFARVKLQQQQSHLLSHQPLRHDQSYIFKHVWYLKKLTTPWVLLYLDLIILKLNISLIFSSFLTVLFFHNDFLIFIMGHYYQLNPTRKSYYKLIYLNQFSTDLLFHYLVDFRLIIPMQIFLMRIYYFFSKTKVFESASNQIDFIKMQIIKSMLYS